MRNFTIVLLFLTQVVFSQTIPGKVWSEYLINDETSNFGLPANSFFGSSIANIGDFNGDGIEDFVVGADGYDGKGAAWLILMNTNFTVKNKYLIHVGLPLNQHDYFGASVSGIADFNGDGIKDIAVGAPGDTTGGNNYGAVYLINLNSNGTVKSYSKITSATTGFVAGDFAANINFGSSLAYLGDFNSDSFKEIAVGAPGKDSFKGAVWILSLKSDGTIQAKNQITSAAITGLANYDGFGSSLAANGTSISANKILVGAPLNEDAADKGTGAIYQISLKSDLTVNSFSRTSINSPVMAGKLSDYDQFGNAVCLAGDIDKNGYNDIMVGAFQTDDTFNASGAVFVLFMDENGVRSIQKISNLDGDLVYDKPAQTQFGSALAPIADMDNNGVPGVVAGMRNFTSTAVNQGGLSFLNLHGNVTTDSISNNQYTSVKAWGTVNPYGEITDVSFEYGTSTNYGNESASSVALGSVDKSVGITLTGLQMGFTYHYRVKAYNSLGVTYGKDKTFNTNNTMYVKQNAAGLNDGTSWTNAFTDLQSALAYAAINPNIIQIWVARGTYKPTSGTDRTISFVMKNGVAIVGGFAGYESLDYDLTLRNFVVNETILSGEIGVLNDNTDNSYHVIFNSFSAGSPLTSGAVLDGFTVTGGYANAVAPHSDGGGMYNLYASPTVRNCIFTNNSVLSINAIVSRGHGGGMYNSNSSPTITDCVFSGNKMDSPNSLGRLYGAGMFNDASSPEITNCTFSNNHSPNELYEYSYGGGMYNNNASPVISGCTFSGNFATYGGGIQIENSTITVTNSTFSGNGIYTYPGGVNGSALNIRSSSATISNCSFLNNGGVGAVSVEYYSGSPVIDITDCTFTGNSYGIACQSASPTVTNCLFTGNTYGGIVNWVGDVSSPLITNCTFSENPGSVLGSISNYGSSTPTLKNCIIWGDGKSVYNQSVGVVSISNSIVKQASGVYPGAGNLNQDPLFVSSGDFQLQVLSPAIDAGTETGAPLTDIDGNTRPVGNGFDMGAYENQNPCANPANGGTISSDQSGCSPFDPAEITGTTPTGQAGTLEYQWQSSTDNTTFNNISIGDYSSINYNPGALTVNTWFKRLTRVTCEVDWVESNVLEVTVDPLPTASAGGSQTICVNGSATVSEASSTNGTINWTHDGAGTLTNETTLAPTYTPAEGDAGNSVILTMTVTSNNTCGTATAAATYTIIVDPLPTASAGGSQTICVDGSATVSGASAANGTINWTHDGAGTLTNETTLTPTYTPAEGDAGNSVILTMTVTSNNTCGTAIASATYTVNVDPLPTASISVAQSQVTIDQGFDNISTLPAEGWYLVNKSNPLGITDWFQGNDGVFPAYDGEPNFYIGANFNNTSGTGTISNWLMTPEKTFNNGDSFSFWTRTVDTPTFPDRLEARLSLNGSSTNVGSSATSVGDFTNLLISINPSLTTNGYPNIWTKYTATITGLSGPTNGRIALRYFVTNGGPTGTNSDYFGIDRFTLTQNTGSNSETICLNATATVSGASASNGSILWSHNGAGTLSGETTLTPTYTPAPGDAGNTVILTMTVTSNNTCGTATATATYSFNVDPTPSASAGGSQIICVNGSATVSGTSAANGTILWTHNGAGTLTNATTLAPTYFPVSADGGGAITLTLTVTSNNACNPQTAQDTYTVNVDPTTVAGSVGGSSSIIYGASTGNLTLTGNTGSIQKWQKRLGTSDAFTDISHTSATYSETPASAGTWQYRVLVESGTCDEAFTDPHSITVEAKELTIGGSFTANDKIYDDNTDATFDSNDLELTGVVGTEDVSLTGLEIDFASKTVGGHTVNITAASLDGTDKENYTLSLTGSPETTATINAGAPVKFLVTNPEGGDITSPKLHNIPFNVKVTLVDAFDNPTPNTGGNVTVTLAGSGGATPGDLRFQGFPADVVTQTLIAGDTTLSFANVLYTGVSAVAGFDVKVSASASGTGTANGKTGESNLFSVRDIFFSVTANPTAILADGTSKTDITVTLEDHDNNPLANQTITVETDKGTLMEGAVELTGVVTRNTDANGQVFLELRSDNVSALATVTAKCPGACPQTAEVGFTLNAPVITGFTPGEEQVTIDFNPPTNTGLTIISNYAYSFDDGGNWTAFSPAQTGSPVTIAGLTGGQTYPAKLRAVNEAGIGAASVAEEVYSCFNPTDGGEIGLDQTICEDGLPDPLTSEVLPTGHFGALEYQWQSSITSNSIGFEDIADSVSVNFVPGALDKTIWFRRLARVSCKADWTGAAESNVVEITVHPKPVAFAGDNATITEGEDYSLLDASAENYTSVSWTTNGDGSFSPTGSLASVYTPGDADVAAGAVELCLTAAPENPCTVDSVDCMTLTIQRHPSISITSPTDGSSVYTNPVTISGTAADADGNLSLIEVKLNGGTWQTATGTDNWTIDLNLVPGKNTILARAKDDTDLYSDTATINVLLSIQIINIPKGWSAISSFLAPLNPDLPVMMDEITDNNNLVIMLSENGIYWPPYNTNTIGNWNVEKGYKVKMNNAQEFTVRGDTVSTRSLSLSQGYHIIPVLSNVGCPINEVFTDPLNDIFFMYDVKTNALYWPQGEIFSLTTLEPGKGYITSFNKAVTLTYPAYSGLKSGINLDNAEPEMNGPWALNRTGDVHFVAISSETVNKLENASFIGAFDSFGNCIGYAEVDGSGDNYLLSIYGNDAFTDVKDGAEEAEPISFRSYNSSTQTETELIAEYNTSFPNADGLYISGGQSGIINFKESSTGIGEAGIAGDVQIYPNPAKDVVNIAMKRFHTLEGFGTLITAEGKLVKTFVLTGNQTQLNVQDLQPGIYLMKIETAEKVVVKRLVIQ